VGLLGDKRDRKRSDKLKKNGAQKPVSAAVHAAIGLRRIIQNSP